MVQVKDEYRKEKNKDVYTDVDNGEQGSYTNEYVKWLEAELLKLFTIPDVSNNEAVICEHCGKYKRLQGNGMMHQLCECDKKARLYCYCGSCIIKTYEHNRK